jgi:hypothetical protein
MNTLIQVAGESETILAYEKHNRDIATIITKLDEIKDTNKIQIRILQADLLTILGASTHFDTELSQSYLRSSNEYADIQKLLKECLENLISITTTIEVHSEINKTKIQNLYVLFGLGDFYEANKDNYETSQKTLLAPDLEQGENVVKTKNSIQVRDLNKYDPKRTN